MRFIKGLSYQHRQTQEFTGIHSPSDSHGIQTELVVDMKQVRRRVSRRFLLTAPMSSRVRLQKGTSSSTVVARRLFAATFLN